MRISNSYIHYACPLCKSEAIRKIGVICYPAPASFSTFELSLDLKPELWKCSHCMSGFVQNILSEESARDLYARGAADKRWPAVSFETEKMKNVVSLLDIYLKKDVTVLDIGCNTGELLDFARRKGCPTSGVEYSDSSREVLLRKGHQVYSFIEEVDGCYDIITAFDLIEHLYDVPKFLEECRKRLAPDGRLILLTGNISSFSSLLCGPGWWYLQYPEHIVFPSKRFYGMARGFKMEKWLLTYASVGYRKSFVRMSAGFLKRMVRRTYAGLPSIGPDHVLVVLKK